MTPSPGEPPADRAQAVSLIDKIANFVLHNETRLLMVSLTQQGDLAHVTLGYLVGTELSGVFLESVIVLPKSVFEHYFLCSYFS